MGRSGLRAHLDTDDQQKSQEVGQVLQGLLVTWHGRARHRVFKELLVASGLWREVLGNL